MKPSIHAWLAAATLTLAVPGVASAQAPTASAETEYLMTYEAQLGPLQQIGPRLVVNLPSGTVHGPKINGAIEPPSGDWIQPMPDGSLRINARTTIKTDDGELILVEWGGVVAPTKEVMDRFNKGEVITSKDEYAIWTERFTTGSKKYDWLNRIQAVGKLVAVQNTKIKIDIFMVH